MSIFNPGLADCPACGTPHRFELVASVNADRRPDLRQAILDGSFQVQACSRCGQTFRPPPLMTYLDVARGWWMLVRPFDHQAHWASSEDAASEVFDSAYGARAAPAARALGQRLKVRVVFGWAALREKLLCDELKLDDVELELLKMALMRDAQGTMLDDAMELRLIGGDAKSLRVAWVHGPSGEPRAALTLPRQAAERTLADRAAWQPLRDSVGGHAFVDIHRAMLIPAA